MFFTASKIVWFLATPSNLLPLVVLAGGLVALAPRARRLGLGLVIVGSLGILAAGLLPVSDLVLGPLEARFPEFQDDGTPVAGVIVLGGAIEPERSTERGQLMVNGAGERILALADLARRYPQARIVFSGGSGNLADERLSEADVAARFAGTLGLADGRLVIEGRSRNTRENAEFSARQVMPKPGERWLLVTSAWHMPRAVGCFRQAGFAVTPYPVDYRTSRSRPSVSDMHYAAEGLLDVDLGTKEWVGLLAYRLAGYTDAVLPGP